MYLANCSDENAVRGRFSADELEGDLDRSSSSFSAADFLIFRDLGPAKKQSFNGVRKRAQAE